MLTHDGAMLTRDGAMLTRDDVLPGRRAAIIDSAPVIVRSFLPLPQPVPYRVAVLVEGGRREVFDRLGAVEAHGRARQFDPAEYGVLDLDDQALGAGLRPGVHLVDGADGPGRDAEVAQGAQPVRAVVAG